MNEIKQTAEPVAWMYTYPGDVTQFRDSRPAWPIKPGWTETPLYTRPPATMPDAEIVEMLADEIRGTLLPVDAAERCLDALRNAGLIGEER